MARHTTEVAQASIRDIEEYRALAKMLGMHAVHSPLNGLWYMMPLGEAFNVDYMRYNPPISYASKEEGDESDQTRGRKGEFFCLWYFLIRNGMI